MTVSTASKEAALVDSVQTPD